MAKTNSTSDLFASFSPPKLNNTVKKETKPEQPKKKETKTEEVKALNETKKTIKEEAVKKAPVVKEEKAEEVAAKKTVGVEKDYSDYERLAPHVGRPKKYEGNFKLISIRIREDLLEVADSKKDKFGSRNEYINYLIAKDNDLM